MMTFGNSIDIFEWFEQLEWCRHVSWNQKNSLLDIKSDRLGEENDVFTVAVDCRVWKIGLWLDCTQNLDMDLEV